MESGNKPKIEDYYLNTGYKFDNFYGYCFYRKVNKKFVISWCRAYNVWAMMAHIQGTANYNDYVFQENEVVRFYFCSNKLEERFETLTKVFNEISKEFKLKKVKIKIVESKDGVKLLEILTTKFWTKSIASYSLFLLLLRKEEEYWKTISREFFVFNKKITQELGWSYKGDKQNLNENGWDNEGHGFGIGEFLNDEVCPGYGDRFYNFKELKEKFEKEKNAKQAKI